jgi:hypothetical protein
VLIDAMLAMSYIGYNRGRFVAARAILPFCHPLGIRQSTPCFGERRAWRR